MEIESQAEQQPKDTKKGDQKSNGKSLALLSLNILLLVIGCCGMPLLLRLYFVHGGHLIWFSTFLQTAAFPLLLPPLVLTSILRHCRQSPNTALIKPKQQFLLITPLIFLSCAVLGVLTGLVNLFYAYGVSYLPVSTSSLLLSTQLCFTAVFAFLIVKQRFTPFSINAVVLLSAGAAVLGVNSTGDRPEEEPRAKYYLGFAMTIATAVLDGLLPTLAELMYLKAGQAVTYTLLMETQLVMGFFATVFCAVGMTVSKELQAISREAKVYGLGESSYYLVIISFAVVMQCFFLGRVGVVLYSSALLTGVVVDVLLPITVVLAVVIFHEPFSGDKAVALVLSVWGFTSYVYGEIKAASARRMKNATVTDPSHLSALEK